MVLLYRRQIHTEVAGLTIVDPRQTLSLDRSDDPTQDRGILDIWNLRDSREQRIEKGQAITVSAGYPETLALVFEGVVEEAYRVRDHLARITRVTLGDMAHRTQRLPGITNADYPGFVSRRLIVTRIVEQDMGLAVGPLDAIPEDAQHLNFYWGAASSQAALNAALAPIAGTHGFRVTWFEEDGLVRFTREGEGGVQSDAPTILLTPQTGLIEAPVKTEGRGVEARSFLNPAIVLGCIVDLRAETLSGRYKVKTVRHSGDNWEGEFISLLQMEPI